MSGIKTHMLKEDLGNIGKAHKINMRYVCVCRRTPQPDHHRYTFVAYLGYVLFFSLFSVAAARLVKRVFLWALSRFPSFAQLMLTIAMTLKIRL